MLKYIAAYTDTAVSLFTTFNSSFKNICYEFTIKSLAVLFLSLVLCVRDP